MHYEKPKPTETVRAVEVLVVEGRVLQPGDPAEADFHTANAWVEAGRAEWTVPVRTLHENMLLNGRVCGVGDEALVSEAFAVAAANRGDVAIVDHSKLRTTDRLKPPPARRVPQPPEPFYRVSESDPETEVRAVRPFFLESRTFAAGEKARIPRSVADRLAAQGVATIGAADLAAQAAGRAVRTVIKGAIGL